MTHRSGVWPGAILIAAALLSGGCGSSDARPRWSVSVDAEWNAAPATAQDLGYTVSIRLDPYDVADQPCSPWPAEMHLQVNGQEEAVAFDDSGCLATQVALGPALQVDPLSVDVLDGTSTVAHAEFDDLAPGAQATLVSPADGTFHGGDDIVVLPPPALPAGYVEGGLFYPLDAVTWSPMATVGTAERLADGIHVTAPALSGRVVLAFDTILFRPSPTVGCTGFALCSAIASGALGPLSLVGAP